MTRRKSPLESYQTDPVDDPEAPELSEEDFKRMRPASELPKKMLDSFPRMRGRPPKSLEERKVQVTLRLHPMIVAHLGKARKDPDVDVTTKMHIALAVMLTLYVVPLVYLVWLAQHQHPEPKAKSKPDIPTKR